MDCRYHSELALSLKTTMLSLLVFCSIAYASEIIPADQLYHWPEADEVEYEDWELYEEHNTPI
jgi:hypothetical protein